jgi:hypothetical protein
VDAYQNNTGLTISTDTQLLFDTALANLAHSKGFTVALKNDVGQLADLKPYFDVASNEQCFQYKEESALLGAEVSASCSGAGPARSSVGI